MSAASRVIELARRQPWLRERAGRAIDAVVAASSASPPGLLPGRWAGDLGRAGDRLPIVVVDCTGVDAARLAELVDHLEQVSAAVGGARFVLVLDGPRLAAGGRGGVVVEQVVDPTAWARRHDPAGWPTYRRRRFDQLHRTYRPHQVVPLASGEWAELQQAITPRAPEAKVRRWLARGERLLDPPRRDDAFGR